MTDQTGSRQPYPGSDKAIDQGCTCPILDNGHGDPKLGQTRGFWITEGCPLHDARVIGMVAQDQAGSLSESNPPDAETIKKGA